MSMVKYRYSLLMEKSRNDDTLLTVDFKPCSVILADKLNK